MHALILFASSIALILGILVLWVMGLLMQPKRQASTSSASPVKSSDRVPSPDYRPEEYRHKQASRRQAMAGLCRM